MRAPQVAAARLGVAPRFQKEGRGIVDAAAGGYYIARRADEELFEHLVERDYCHVLAPRQIGKSSLRVRTQERLRARGIRCASVDLTGIGSHASPDEWYFSLASAIAEALALPDDPADLWQKERRLSTVRRFRQFLHDAVLGGEGPPVVVFIDEIDVTLSLPFSRDDFFGLIRALQQARADDARWRRLTFVLVGVASPLDLIANPERTPFSSSVAVNLEDFTHEEARVFLPGLACAGGDAATLLHAVLGWTDGHPALTQRLCYRLSQQEGAAQGAPPGPRVDALVEELFLASGRIEDPILLDAERRFAGDRPDARIPVMLHLYQRLLADENVPADGNNPRQFGLRIAGLAAERRTESGIWLRTRNRIFASVFDKGWVDEKLARRFLTEPLQIWKDAGRRDDHVLRGDALEIALGWSRGREDVSPDERDFLQASQAVARKEEEQTRRAERDRAERERAEDKAQEERRKSRQNQWFAACGIVLATIAATAAVYTDQLRRKAQASEVRERDLRASAEAVADKWERAVAAIQSDLVKTNERSQAALADATEAQALAARDAETAREEAVAAQAKLDEATKAFGGWSWTVQRLRDEARKKDEVASRLNESAMTAATREADARGIAEKAARALEQKDSIISALQESRRAAHEAADRKGAELDKARMENAALVRDNADLKARLEKALRERDALPRQSNTAAPSMLGPGPAGSPRRDDADPYR